MPSLDEMKFTFSFRDLARLAFELENHPSSSAVDVITDFIAEGSSPGERNLARNIIERHKRDIKENKR